MSDPGHSIVAIGELLWDLLPGGRQLGGSPANFACHVTELGTRGTLVSQVGNDALGDEALALLRQRGVDIAHVARSREHPTGTVSVELEDGGIPAFTIHEDVAWDFIGCPPEVLELAATADALFFGTLAQRHQTSRQTVRRLLDASPPACLRLLDVNLRQEYYDADLLAEALETATVLKASEEELCTIGELIRLPGDPTALPRNLARTFDLTAVAVTRGPQGALLRIADEEVEHSGFAAAAATADAAPYATGPADTVGAGDAFGAALCVGLLRGHRPDLIVENANRLAAYVCSQPGAVPLIPDELKDRLTI